MSAFVVLGCAPTLGASPPVGHPEPEKIAPPVSMDVADTESDSSAVTSKVSKVVVYSDRARITRKASVELTEEPTVFAFRHLPGWVDDGSVRVSSSAGSIVDVRVDRDFLATASNENWQKVEAEHKALSYERAALNDELLVLAAEKQQIESIKAFSNAKITQDTFIGDVKVESYAKVLHFITDALRENAKARRAVTIKLAELEPEYEASKRRLDSMQNLMKLEETTVLVTLQGSKARSANLELTYMLPGVTWEPMHELRVSADDSQSVDMISFAEVTQTSGEDWRNVELSFSTQSSTQSVRIPELEALTLGDTHSAREIITTKITSFDRAQKAFEGQNRLWNQYQQNISARRARESFERVYQSNIEYLQIVQSKTVKIFESLQKRGTTAHYRAEDGASVRGDGHPVRVPIGHSTLASKQKIVAAPEQSLNAAHTLSLLNSTDQSFLPGRVALYRDGTFLGMTNMDFIAKGERFSLFLAVADHLKLTRELNQKQSSLVRRKRNRMKVAFIVTVENLSDEPTSLVLADRIPVSENREIKVQRVSITPSVDPDSRGILSWDLSLAARERRQFRIAYEVEYPEQLILETRRRRRMNRSAPARAPGAPAAAPQRQESYQIEDQIMDLEEML